jgi:hypothetical protein
VSHRHLRLLAALQQSRRVVRGHPPTRRARPVAGWACPPTPSWQPRPGHLPGRSAPARRTRGPRIGRAGFPCTISPSGPPTRGRGHARVGQGGGRRAGRPAPWPRPHQATSQGPADGPPGRAAGGAPCGAAKGMSQPQGRVRRAACSAAGRKSAIELHPDRAGGGAVPWARRVRRSDLAGGACASGGSDFRARGPRGRPRTAWSTRGRCVPSPCLPLCLLGSRAQGLGRGCRRVCAPSIPAVSHGWRPSGGPGAGHEGPGSSARPHDQRQQLVGGVRCIVAV